MSLENISYGGCRVTGFSLGDLNLGKPEPGGVFLPAWLAGISAGLTATQLAMWAGFPLPPRGVFSSLAGVATGLAVWAKLR
jgi:hypothetical protein